MMEVTYFDFWDYRKVKKYSWQECGYEYDPEMVKGATEHPEWFTYSNPAPILQFPQEPEELGIFPYSEDEIAYLESELNYKFPKAFKELLFLYGGKILDPNTHSKFRTRYINEKGYQKLNIDEDVKNLKRLQKRFKNDYINWFGEAPDEGLFVIEDFSDQIEIFISISNKDDKASVYSYSQDQNQGPNPHVHKIHDSLVNGCKEGGFNLEILRDDVEHNFYSGFTSKHSAKLLQNEIKSLLNSKYSENSKKVKVIGYHKQILRIENLEEKTKFSILITYEGMPDYQYKQVLNSYLFGALNSPFTFIRIDFKEIVENKRNIASKILELVL